MKKLLIVLIMLVLLIPTVALATGTCVITQSGSQPGAEHRWVHYTCTADGSGLMAAYTVTGFFDFYIYSVETWPGGTAPTDASDFTLLDAITGEDLMGGNGTDAIDATTPKTVLPKSAAAGLNFYHMVKGNLSLVIVQQAAATNNAIMNVRITGVR